MNDLEELKRLAQEARDEGGIVPGPKRMTFVAAANPAAVLALIERVERAEAKEKRSESVLAQGEDTVRVYEFWKQNPDGSTAYRVECAECGTVFRKSGDEDEE